MRRTKLKQKLVLIQCRQIQRRNHQLLSLKKEKEQANKKETIGVTKRRKMFKICLVMETVQVKLKHQLTQTMSLILVLEINKLYFYIIYFQI
jgi:hypothetical protein